MRSIGLRCEKDLVQFIVLEGDKDPRTVIADGKLEIGEKKNICQELCMLRTQLRNVFETYKPEVGGMRFSDKPKGTTYIQSSFARARVEGVVMVVAGEFGINLKAGAAGTIKAGMKTKTSLKEYAGMDDIRGIDVSSRGKKNDVYRDAVAAAFAGLGGK